MKQPSLTFLPLDDRTHPTESTIQSWASREPCQQAGYVTKQTRRYTVRYYLQCEQQEEYNRRITCPHCHQQMDYREYIDHCSLEIQVEQKAAKVSPFASQFGPTVFPPLQVKRLDPISQPVFKNNILKQRQFPKGRKHECQKQDVQSNYFLYRHLEKQEFLSKNASKIHSPSSSLFNSSEQHKSKVQQRKSELDSLSKSDAQLNAALNINSQQQAKAAGIQEPLKKSVVISTQPEPQQDFFQTQKKKLISRWGKKNKQSNPAVGEAKEAGKLQPNLVQNKQPLLERRQKQIRLSENEKGLTNQRTQVYKQVKYRPNEKSSIGETVYLSKQVNEEGIKQVINLRSGLQGQKKKIQSKDSLIYSQVKKPENRMNQKRLQQQVSQQGPNYARLRGTNRLSAAKSSHYFDKFDNLRVSSQKQQLYTKISSTEQKQAPGKEDKEFSANLNSPNQMLYGGLKVESLADKRSPASHKSSQHLDSEKHLYYKFKTDQQHKPPQLNLQQNQAPFKFIAQDRERTIKSDKQLAASRLAAQAGSAGIKQKGQRQRVEAVKYKIEERTAQPMSKSDIKLEQRKDNARAFVADSQSVDLQYPFGRPLNQKHQARTNVSAASVRDSEEQSRKATISSAFLKQGIPGIPRIPFAIPEAPQIIYQQKSFESSCSVIRDESSRGKPASGSQSIRLPTGEGALDNYSNYYIGLQNYRMPYPVALHDGFATALNVFRSSQTPKSEPLFNLMTKEDSKQLHGLVVSLGRYRLLLPEIVSDNQQKNWVTAALGMTPQSMPTVQGMEHFPALPQSKFPEIQLNVGRSGLNAVYWGRFKVMAEQDRFLVINSRNEVEHVLVKQPDRYLVQFEGQVAELYIEGAELVVQTKQSKLVLSADTAKYQGKQHLKIDSKGVCSLRDFCLERWGTGVRKVQIFWDDAVRVDRLYWVKVDGNGLFIGRSKFMRLGRGAESMEVEGEGGTNFVVEGSRVQARDGVRRFSELQRKSESRLGIREVQIRYKVGVGNFMLEEVYRQ